MLVVLQIATLDRGGRTVMAYAAEGSPTHGLLSSHLEVLENIANERQVRQPWSLVKAPRL